MFQGRVYTRITLAGIIGSIRVKCEGQCGRADEFGRGGTVKGNGRQKKEERGNERRRKEKKRFIMLD